jgi:hypothetical protein
MTFDELQVACWGDGTSGSAVVPNTHVTSPGQPLFLPEQCHLKGESINATYNGRIVAGWKLKDGASDLFPADRWDANGFETGPVTGGNGSRFFMTHGTYGFDVLAINTTKITVRYIGVMNEGFASATWDNGAWQARLMGIQDQSSGLSNEPHPSPWLLTWHSEDIRFYYKTSDGVERFITIPADHTAATCDVIVIIDVANGTVSALIDNSPVTPTGTVPSGLKFAENVLWPFMVGRLGWNGHWGEEIWGQWINYVSVKYEGESTVETVIDLTGPSGVGLGAICTGGPQNPAYGSLLTTHISQGLNNYWVTKLAIDDLYVKASPGGNDPAIMIAAAQADVCRMRGASVDLGARGLQTGTIGVVYPLELLSCVFKNHTDCNLHLYQSTVNFSVEGGALKGAGRRGAVVWRSSGNFRSPFCAPGTWVGHQPRPWQPMEQFGGAVSYENVSFDYEPGVDDELPESFLLLHPTPCGEDPVTWPTGAEITDCGAGNAGVDTPPMVLVTAREAGYTGPVTVRTMEGLGKYHRKVSVDQGATRIEIQDERGRIRLVNGPYTMHGHFGENA